jgi:hypothetical protein
MAYRVELVASPPRPITWDELARATGSLPGWKAHDREQELRLTEQSRLLTRITLHQGEASAKLPDERALAALIRLATQVGLRIRGDDGESYRSATETFVHPDDADLHDSTPALPIAGRKAQGATLWSGSGRIAALAVVMLVFALLGLTGNLP